MTETEKGIVSSLRLSPTAADKLLPTIQRNIETARAELIRSGVSEEVVEAEGALVVDCIIAFCLMRMGEESDRAWNEASFRNQQENLRRS